MDVGEARIGLATADADALVVLPLETVPAHPRSKAVRQVARVAREREAIEVVVGLPKNMSGDEGPAAGKARRFAAELANRLPGVRVCLIDERLTTSQAQGILHEAGLDTRRSRNVIDQMAARIILEQAVELERATGTLPGESVDANRASEGL